MANEAEIIELINGGEPISYTVADGTGIAKGTVLKLADPRTASATSSSGDKFAGIAAIEKTADDGVTKITAYTKGIFDMKDSGSGITAGTLVSTAGANTIKTATATEVEGGAVIGKALETASANEVIAVAVGVLY